MNAIVHDQELAFGLNTMTGSLPLEHGEKMPPRSTSAERRMARQPGTLGSSTASVTLERADGVLRWAYRRSPRALGPRRANRLEPESAGAVKVHEFRFQEVPPNEIVMRLEKLDAWFNPTCGLHRWLPPSDATGDWTRSDFDASLPAVLLIHGTFSNSAMFFKELQHTEEGRTALRSFAADGRQLLTFDHPTIAVSPLLNAFDLQHALADYTKPLDVVCHSRGGLVAAWWLRLTTCNVRHVVFVGAPLEGTSLAAPARLKATLDYLANFAGTVSRAGSLAGTFVPPLQPFLATAAGLMAIIGGVLHAGARTPLADAGVALIPGLQGQSRVANNQELQRLHRKNWKPKFRAYAIRSSFEPLTPDAPVWKFWKRWTTPVTRIAGGLAAPLFDGANDLVVDCATMSRLCGEEFADIHPYEPGDQVHHCNYFAQVQTAKLLEKWLAP